MSFCVDQCIIYVNNYIFMPVRTTSISLWMVAGQPSRPDSDMIQLYSPLLGMVKAVKCCYSISNYI
jgi:hypothetical protein